MERVLRQLTEISWLTVILISQIIATVPNIRRRRQNEAVPHLLGLQVTALMRQNPWAHGRDHAIGCSGR